MRAKWYIGESRAQALLKYSQGVLGKYAYQIPYDGYIKIWNIMRTSIPLWVEERRGPINAQGEPLYSEEQYKKYIDWWINQLVAQFVEPKETKVKASGWITSVFSDPATRVFGTRISASQRIAAASVGDQLTPGDYGAVDSVLENIRSIDIPASVGEDYIIDLLIWCGGKLNSYIGTYPQSAQASLEPAKRYILNWLKNYFSTWKTAGLKDEARAAGYAAQPTNWMDPNRPAINLLEGPGKIDMIKDALGELLWYALAAFASSNAPSLSTEWFTSRNMPFPTDVTGPGLAAKTGLTAPANLNLTELPRNPYTDSSTIPAPPGETFIRSLAQIMEMRNDIKWLAYEIGLQLGDSPTAAAKKARDFVSKYGETKSYATFTAGNMEPGVESTYKSELSALVKTEFGFDWIPD